MRASGGGGFTASVPKKIETREAEENGKPAIWRSRKKETVVAGSSHKIRKRKEAKQRDEGGEVSKEKGQEVSWERVVDETHAMQTDFIGHMFQGDLGEKVIRSVGRTRGPGKRVIGKVAQKRKAEETLMLKEGARFCPGGRKAMGGGRGGRTERG